MEGWRHRVRARSNETRDVAVVRGFRLTGSVRSPRLAAFDVRRETERRTAPHLRWTRRDVGLADLRRSPVPPREFSSFISLPFFKTRDKTRKFPIFNIYNRIRENERFGSICIGFRER